MAGVSNAAVTRATKTGILKDATYKGKIDINHPSAREYIHRAEQKKGQLAPVRRAATRSAPSGQAAKRLKRVTADTPDLPAETVAVLAKDIAALAHMPLIDLVTIFGSDLRFKDWLDALKKIEEIHDKRIKNAKATGDLVARDLIAKGIIDPFDRAHRLILTDGARTISQRLQAKFKAGITAPEAETFVRDTISKILQPAKKQISDTLRENSK